MVGPRLCLSEFTPQTRDARKITRAAEVVAEAQRIVALVTALSLVCLNIGRSRLKPIISSMYHIIITHHTSHKKQTIIDRSF